MIGGKNYRGTIYGRYTVEGNDNPLWAGTTCDMLMKFLDLSAQADDKNLAVSILTFCAERAKNDPMVAGFWNELEANAAWEFPQAFVLKDVTKGGSTRKEVVCIQQEFMLPPMKSAPTVAAPDIDEEL